MPSLSRKILVVEDNPADVRLMREALRGLTPPITLEVAPDADAARLIVDKALADRAGYPWLIFLDFNLPKSGSRDFLLYLKTQERLRLIPVAVLTTSEADRDVWDAYSLHANCYLRKAVDLDTFLATIRSAAHFWFEVALTMERFEADLSAI